jgi:hypothetical protein
LIWRLSLSISSRCLMIQIGRNAFFTTSEKLCYFFTKVISMWFLCSQYSLLPFLVKYYVDVSFSMCKSLMGIQILSLGRNKAMQSTWYLMIAMMATMLLVA